MYKVQSSLIPPPLGQDRKFFKFVGEEYQVVKRGREYHNVEKRKSGSNIIFPIILRLLGRISSKGKLNGKEIWGKIIKLKNIGDGEKYKVVGNFIHP